MFIPLRLENFNGYTELINLSQICNSYDEVLENGETVTVLEFANGDGTRLAGAERQKYLSVETVYAEYTKAQAYQLAQQIDAAAKAAPAQPAA